MYETHKYSALEIAETCQKKPHQIYFILKKNNVALRPRWFRRDDYKLSKKHRMIKAEKLRGKKHSEERKQNISTSAKKIAGKRKRDAQGRFA